MAKTPIKQCFYLLFETFDFFLRSKKQKQKQLVFLLSLQISELMKSYKLDIFKLGFFQHSIFLMKILVNVVFLNLTYPYNCSRNSVEITASVITTSGEKICSLLSAVFKREGIKLTELKLKPEMRLFFI